MAATIRRVTTDAERRQCYAVRFAVFVNEQRVPPDEEMDALDDTATHYLVEDGGRIVGTARLLDLGDRTCKIGRVALLPDCRGRGIGAELMRRVMADAFARFDAIVLDAQVSVIPFYERLGFVAEGPVFLDAGIDHRRMTLRRPPEGRHSS
jgi:predicted GNAT family N-acyltransferase